jgi:hypothetical protein
LPAAPWYLRIFIVCGFSAEREKPHTIEKNVPRFPNGVEGLLKA